MPQRLTVVGPNLDNSARAEFHVHAEGCQDLTRGVCKRAEQKLTAAFASLVEVCDAFYPPEDFECESGQYLGQFYFAPCVTLSTEPVSGP